VLKILFILSLRHMYKQCTGIIPEYFSINSWRGISSMPYVIHALGKTSIATWIIMGPGIETLNPWRDSRAHDMSSEPRRRAFAQGVILLLHKFLPWEWALSRFPRWTMGLPLKTCCPRLVDQLYMLQRFCRNMRSHPLNLHFNTWSLSAYDITALIFYFFLIFN
jgi:hypothetical protein